MANHFKIFLFFIILLFLSSSYLFSQDNQGNLSEVIKKIEIYTLISGQFGYSSFSEERSDNNAVDTDMSYEFNSSQLGFAFSQDEFSGLFELRYNKDTGTSVYYAWGSYKFDSVFIKWGIFDTPNAFFSDQVLNDYNGFLGFGASSEELPTLQFQIIKNDFYLNLAEPNLPLKNGTTYQVAGLSDVQDIDSFIPKIIIGYDFFNPIINAGIGIGYQSYFIVEGVMSDKIVNSGLFFGHSDINLGKIKILANLSYGMNTNEYGLYQEVENDIELNSNSTKFENTFVFEGFFEAGYEFSSTTIYLGYGYLQSTNKNWTYKDKAQSLFLSLPIRLNKYFIITPEITYNDFMKNKDGDNDGNELYIGTNIAFEF